MCKDANMDIEIGGFTYKDFILETFALEKSKIPVLV
jgi:hypothetical protein